MASQSLQIAVVGGGPAGALLAYRLASGGKETALFHSPSQREKACGGGTPFRTFKRFPELQELSLPSRKVFEIVFFNRKGRKTRVRLREPLTVFSRKVFDNALRSLAASAGARVVLEKVERIKRRGRGFQLSTPKGQYHADFLAGADGALGRCRKWLLANWPCVALSFACGYYLPLPETRGNEDWRTRIYIQFLEGQRGYFWSFPRMDHLSVGLGCFPGERDGSRMLARVREFVRERLDPSLLKTGKPFAGMIPILDYLRTDPRRICGKNWALLGDAAGFTNPITGEGIYYALASASLLARAILGGEPELYASLCGKNIFEEMKEASRFSRSFYSPGFPEKVLFFAKIFPSVKRILRDMLSETLSYRHLERRLTKGPLFLFKKKIHEHLYRGEGG